MRTEAELSLSTRAGADSLFDFVDLLFDIPAMAVRAADSGLLFPADIGRQSLVLFAIAVVKMSAPTHLIAEHQSDVPRVTWPVLPRDVNDIIPDQTLRKRNLFTDETTQAGNNK